MKILRIVFAKILIAVRFFVKKRAVTKRLDTSKKWFNDSKEERNMGKKGENIYKRKDGRWEARYIKEYALNGKVRYGYCYGKTYREAKEKEIIRSIFLPIVTNG